MFDDRLFLEEKISRKFPSKTVAKIFDAQIFFDFDRNAAATSVHEGSIGLNNGHREVFCLVSRRHCVEGKEEEEEEDAHCLQFQVNSRRSGRKTFTFVFAFQFDCSVIVEIRSSRP